MQNPHHRRPCSLARPRGPDSVDNRDVVVGSQNPGTVELRARLESRGWLRDLHDPASLNSRRCCHAQSITIHSSAASEKEKSLVPKRRGPRPALQGTLDAMFTYSFPSLLSLAVASPSFFPVQSSEFRQVVLESRSQFEIHAFAHAPRKPALYNWHEQNIYLTTLDASVTVERFEVARFKPAGNRTVASWGHGPCPLLASCQFSAAG
jgi:hypothetical protein